MHVNGGSCVKVEQWSSEDSKKAERGTGVGEADVAAVVAKAKALMEAKATDVEADIDDGFATKFLRHFHTALQPFAAFLGGICAQEVVKVAGKFTPIPGWLHFNAVEALPDSPPADAAPQGSRYDALAAVYGHSFVKKLQNLKYFMVGCGALGCEFLKNFALNGVCCGPDGLLTVTDADRIELSNLTRQFLFREHNVGQPKSKAATAMAQVMNPGMKVRALEMFVGPKTEDSFNDEFWMSLDGVCNALDNMEARFYVDDQCVKYEKPLLESGTMGPAGNVDPVVPFKTQTYKDGGQADEGGGIPMCTLRNFPHLPDHCIEWARDQFELFFVKSVKQLKKFHEDPTAFISEIGTSTDVTQSIFEVRGLLSLLTAAAAPSVRSAGQSAFDFFHLLFRDKILDLTAAFPATARIIDPETKQDKGAFWSGHKRFPQATTYDPENETHWRFLVSATGLFAAMLGAIPVKMEGDNTWCQDMRSKGWAASLSKDLVVPQYVAGGVNMDGDTTAGDVTAGAKSDSKAILAGLLQQLEAFKEKPLPALEEADFEKDDDFNFHIEFITRCANLRADNYHIANSDFHKVKLVAGRIVPAIATTTAAVCGLDSKDLGKEEALEAETREAEAAEQRAAEEAKEDSAVQGVFTFSHYQYGLLITLCPPWIQVQALTAPVNLQAKDAARRLEDAVCRAEERLRATGPASALRGEELKGELRDLETEAEALRAQDKTSALRLSALRQAMPAEDLRCLRGQEEAVRDEAREAASLLAELRAEESATSLRVAALRTSVDELRACEESAASEASELEAALRAEVEGIAEAEAQLQAERRKRRACARELQKVMLELFKLLLGKGTEGFRTRQVGLAVNTYTSFEAQEPKTFASGVEKKVPRAEDLPPDAFDSAGKIKAEYVVEEAYASYPEKHSVWDKIVVPTGTMTLEAFKGWLASEHKLQLRTWSFVLGWKKVVDEENKEMRVPVSCQIYPPPVSVDAALLPPLTDAQGDAMKKIMGSAQIPQAQKMKYLGEWKKAKETGKMPSSSGQEIRGDMSLKDILALMEVRAEKALQDGSLNPKWGKAISDLKGRRFCSQLPISGSRFSVLVVLLDVDQVMSAQAEGARLRESSCQGQGYGAMAEETAAVLTGEALHAESVTPQMNGVAGGGSERRADGAEATTSTRTETATGEDAPSGSGNAEAVVQEMRQGEQTRTDINSQGVASGVAFAAEFSGGAAVQAGHGEDEARSWEICYVAHQPIGCRAPCLRHRDLDVYLIPDLYVVLLDNMRKFNDSWEEELEITRRDRNRLAESQAHTACSPVQERDFAGGVTGDLEHGNNPVGLPEPRGDHFIGQGDGEGIPRRQSGDDVPVTNPRTGAWRDPIGALWDGLQSRISPPTEQDRGSAHPQFFAGLDEDSKPRESGDLTTTAILEALTKNLTSLQELQAKNMKRDADSEDAPEQVKNAVVSLPPLPGPDGVGAGIVFQDWLAQVAIPMRDLSASSAQWWDDVLKLVRDSYSKWLAATPLERLQLEPTGHEDLNMMVPDGSVAGASPSTVSPSLNVMAIRNGPPGSGVEGSFALVDSGATHALRRAMSSDEWEAAKPVVVNLAGGESVCLRINEAGTILIPCSTPESSTSSSPIVPLGALVEQLGYMMCWKGSKCKLVGEDGQVIQLRVREGCPEITECEALRLIAQLEDRRLEELRMNTSRTSQRVKAAALAMDKTWFDHFLSYVDSEFASEAHKAIETAGFLDGVPRQCVAGMFDAIPETNGWKVLPGLKHLNRKYRKRLWRSKSWVVHLFAGERKQPELYHLDNHGQVVLELDIARGRSQNILDPAVWRVLEWAARQGRISAIIGGPPQGSFMISRHIPCGPEPLRSNEFPYGGWSGQSDKDLYEVNRHTTLYVRMIVLHALATAGRIRHHTEPSQHKEVAFMIEQPRDPRGYLKFGDPLYPDVVSFWRTPLWMEYALEAGLYTYSFDMAAFGKAYTRMTTLGTNLPLPHLHGLRMKFEVGAEPADPAPAMVWPQEFREKLVLALRQWLQVPRMLRMSADQWRDHVRRGHLPFRADCAVCVQAGATGRRHSKVEHPSAFVLSADLSGPVKIGGVDPDGRGAFPKQYKYIFAAKLRIPKSFVDDGRGVWAGYEVGELKAEDFDDVDDGLAPADSEPKPYEKERDKDIDVEEEPELKPEARRDHEEDLDLAGPELVNLIFSCGLKDDKATSVLEAVQDVVLYCRSLNIPILRFHSDNGMEFRARATRQWLKGEGIRVTTSEPGVHQTNGTAESTVRWLKQRARTLLLSAGLPQHLWPSALSAATSLQRGEVLGFEPKLAAPYGAKVLVRKRHMEGPKQEDLAPKWVSGHYLGLSDSLSKGHLVYVKDDHGERFIHTLHVRAGLHDPGPVEDTVEAELPRSPERRVRGKAAGSGDVVEVSKARVVDESELQQRAEKLLRDWSQEEAESLVVEVARICPDDERCYGMFRHGGRLGITKATVERPWFARLLSRVLRERSPDAEFAAVFVSANNQREVHIDRNNAVGTVNHLLPLSMPRRGGDLWLELRDGDVVSGKVLELVSQEGRVRYGCAHSLQEGKVFAFDPHRRHAVLPWNGERIVIVGYTPGLLASVSRKDREVLWDLQFPLPLHDDDVEVPEIYINAMSIKAITRPKSIEEENVPIRGGGWKEVVPTSDGDYLFTCDWSISRTSSTTIGERSQAERSPPQGEDQVRQEKWDDWEMRLVLDDVEDGVATASLCQGGARVPYIHKTEVAYTDAAEELLKGLSSPLSVVHTVSPSEASSHLEHWIPAIAKEAQSLEHAVIKVQETAAEVQQDIASGVAQVIPMKLVFSLKPPDSEGQGFYKRKARIVICGNLATHKPDDVYASTAPAEVVRAAIALATYFKWDLGMIDIVAAFLQTPLCAVKGAPRVYGKPPKLLVKAGICKPGELWLLTHAVYGLQESPRLWGAYRDQLLADLCLEIDGKEVVLSQGGVESSWWRVQERTTSKLVGILVVYVDDILLCGATNTVRLLAQAIQRLWKTSPLQFVEEKEIRFLGIEVARVPGGYSLSQKSYINELLRLHKMPDRRRDLVPIAKESATFIAEDNEGPQSEEEIRLAQQVAGELLWISQRTRPDIAFACSLIGSLATRAPRRAVDIGYKVLAFLQRTKDRRLVYEGSIPILGAFVDASFAPDSNRSHTGWLIQLAGNTIAWRSSRQACITLSTAEAELEAATEGLVALQGIQAVLQDIGAGVFRMEMHSDSTSALAIAKGSCSWRTRHLRLKSAWMGELVDRDVVVFNHCSGDVQPADMLTKPLSSGRLRSLSELIGLSGEDHSSNQREDGHSDPRVSSSRTNTLSPIPKVLIALLVLAQAAVGERIREDQAIVVYGSGVSVDYSMLTWMLLWLALLLGLLGWEAVKWAAWKIYDQATPGASARRLRRLQRLRDATADAIQKEVSQRSGSRGEQRALDSTRGPREQRPDPPRDHRREPSQEERAQILMKLARGIKETANTAVQTTAFMPVTGPQTRVILRYVHEPPGEVYTVPGNECFHVYPDCHAFRHRGTLAKVEKRRLCQYCSHRAEDDPDKIARFWVIPTDQTPDCAAMSASGETLDVRYMARLEAKCSPFAAQMQLLDLMSGQTSLQTVALIISCLERGLITMEVERALPLQLQWVRDKVMQLCEVPTHYLPCLLWLWAEGVHLDSDYFTNRTPEDGSSELEKGRPGRYRRR
ncbi:Ubiquitin-activating enzyme E1 2 [Symbiodinium microadriaticum]|uniref:Ubiquitin-activating enzyme E1 2 n=1 Tax=Symbiodinium microadriaticum TaxID=2951 RepID=A0A1Q9DXL2_SYMMI|nr:Ubiquitin-activating enzyme E1 2 [Symbiodinium microadriaticum]